MKTEKGALNIQRTGGVHRANLGCLLSKVKTPELPLHRGAIHRDKSATTKSESYNDTHERIRVGI